MGQLMQQNVPRPISNTYFFSDLMPDPIKYIQLDSSSEKNSKPYSRLFFKVSMKPSEITVRLLKSPAYHEFSFLSPSGWILNDFVVFCNIFFFKIIRILLRKFIYLDVALTRGKQMVYLCVYQKQKRSEFYQEFNLD